jgi:hypothetical protein
MTSRGADLLAELADADAAITECWHDWDVMLYAHRATGTPQADRDAWYDRLTQVQDARQAIADKVWGYFQGQEATAEEQAAWTLWDPRWQHARKRR